MRSRRVAFAGLVLAGAASAAAQPPEAGGQTVNLQRFDATSHVGLDSMWIDARGDRWLLRLELHGQYVEPRTGLGAYVQVPYTRLHQSSDPFNGQLGTLDSFGHLELGALWAHRARGSAELVFHGGVAIPIDRDQADGNVASIGALLKPHELYATWHDVTSARGGASLLLHGEHLFARFDAGIDVVATSSFEDRMPGLHANAAAGVRSSEDVSLALELSTLTMFVDKPISFVSANTGFTSNELLASIALSVRVRRAAFELYAALVTPLRDRQRYYVSSGITLGIEYAIP